MLGRARSALVLACTLAAVATSAAQLTSLPELSFDGATNPKLSSEEMELEISFDWPKEAMVQAYSGELPQSEMFCRITRGGEVLASASIPLIDEETTELVTTGKCGDTLKLTAGYRTVTVDVSLTDDFAEATSMDIRMRVIPGWITLIPPIVTIILAVTVQQVHIALFTGVWLCAFFIHWFDPFRGFLRAIDTYVLESFADSGHVTVIMFDWFLSGITTLLQRAGGSDGIAQAVIRFAKTRRATMIVCFICGLAIFFDDYSNTLIVGSTFRPMFDDMLISREKLSYVVDSTSAPIASISPVSSWVGYELSLITESYSAIEDQMGVDLKAEYGWDTSAFIVFVKTIPGRYYPIGMLVLQAFLIFMQRDFFTMLRAERRVLHTGKLVADDADRSQTEVGDALSMKEGVPARWYNAVIPVCTIILFVVLGLVFTGLDVVQNDPEIETSIQNIFGNSDSYMALLYATFSVSILTILFFRMQYYVPGEDKHLWFWQVLGKNHKHQGAKPLMGVIEGLMTWIEGIKNLVSTIMVLILAWSIGFAMTELGTDTFIASAVSQSIDPRAIPALTFIIACAVSCATGTSWGTMAIMFPIATKAIFQAKPGDEDAMLNTIASILAGSVFGDHISPISDTTILSALSSRCDLMHHVKTQAPYALVVGSISVIFGDILVGYLYPNWAGLLVTIIAVVVVSYFISAPVDSPKPDAFGRLEGLFGKKSSTDERGDRTYGSGSENDNNMDASYHDGEYSSGHKKKSERLGHEHDGAQNV